VNEDLTFGEFSRFNRERCASPSGFAEPLDESSAWTPTHWALQVCAEAGELADAVTGVTGMKKRKAHLTVEDVGGEIADIIAYCDLLAARFGLSLADVVLRKFNKVSSRINYPPVVRRESAFQLDAAAPPPRNPGEPR